MLPQRNSRHLTEATDISGWVIDSAGVNAAGWGLTLSPADMDRIEQLYLNGGTWNGKRMCRNTGCARVQRT